MSADGGDVMQIGLLPFSRFVGKSKKVGELEGCLQVALGWPNILIRGFDEIVGMEQSGMVLYTSSGHGTAYPHPKTCLEMAQELIKLIPGSRYPKPSFAEMPEDRKGWEIYQAEGKNHIAILWAAWV